MCERSYAAISLFIGTRKNGKEILLYPGLGTFMNIAILIGCMRGTRHNPYEGAVDNFEGVLIAFISRIYPQKKVLRISNSLFEF